MSEENLMRALEAMNLRMQQPETTLAHFAAENQQMTQRLAAATPLTRSAPSGHQGLVDTRILGKPNQFTSDWSSTLRSYMGEVDTRYQQLMMDAETSTEPMFNATLRHDEVRLSTQLFHALVMLTSRPALDKCHNVGLNEGFED